MKKIVLGRKNSVITSVVVGLVIASGAFTIWALSTNKGDIMAAPDSAAPHAPALATLDGAYVSFKYSDSYKRETLPTDSDNLEGYDFTANTNYEKHLAVTVHRLDTTGLNAFTGYTARDSRTDLYDKQQLTVDQSPAIEFSKKDHTEKTIFITRGTSLAVFSFVTTSRYDNIDSEITAILNSFMWKQ